MVLMSSSPEIHTCREIIMPKGIRKATLVFGFIHNYYRYAMKIKVFTFACKSWYENKH